MSIPVSSHAESPFSVKSLERRFFPDDAGVGGEDASLAERCVLVGCDAGGGGVSPSNCARAEATSKSARLPANIPMKPNFLSVVCIGRAILQRKSGIFTLSRCASQFQELPICWHALWPFS